jgi:hypothetical protein
MENLDELLDALNSATGLSDRKLGVVLGAGEGAATAWRSGRSFPTDDKARKIAELLKLQPAYVAAIIHAARAERANDDASRAMWQRVAAKFAAVVAVAGAQLLNAPESSVASNLTKSELSKYTLRDKRRREASASRDLAHA